jgi:hypothetical protein
MQREPSVMVEPPEPIHQLFRRLLEADMGRDDPRKGLGDPGADARRVDVVRKQTH